MAASADLVDLLARALAGEDAAFATLVTAHERSVFRHCYRMLGSGPDAEDAVQDTLERLAPRQRAALLLHDVLGFSHAETAEVLAVSASAVNSLLSRARETVQASLGAPVPDITDPRVQQFRERYVRAWQLADIGAFVRLVAEDVRFSMPPLSAWFDGREAAARFIDDVVFAAARPHGVTLRAGSCNGQPAFATYASKQASTSLKPGNRPARRSRSRPRRARRSRAGSRRLDAGEPRRPPRRSRSAARTSGRAGAAGSRPRRSPAR
jgi:ketosteroid isomerase-like protein